MKLHPLTVFLFLLLLIPSISVASQGSSGTIYFNGSPENQTWNWSVNSSAAEMYNGSPQVTPKQAVNVSSWVSAATPPLSAVTLVGIPLQVSSLLFSLMPAMTLLMVFFLLSGRLFNSFSESIIIFFILFSVIGYFLGLEWSWLPWVGLLGFSILLFKWVGSWLKRPKLEKAPKYIFPEDTSKSKPETKDKHDYFRAEPNHPEEWK
jgi:hypothetical protein